MSDKERALEIIRASLYATPMMDAVQDVKQALKTIPKLHSAILLAVACGTPIEVFREFGFWRITELIQEASADFLEIIDETYG